MSKKDREIFFKKINRIINIKKKASSGAKGLNLVCELKENVLYSSKMTENVKKLINERMVPTLNQFGYDKELVRKLSIYGSNDIEARSLLDKSCENKDSGVDADRIKQIMSSFTSDSQNVSLHLEKIKEQIKISLDIAADKYSWVLGREKAENLSPFTEKQILSLFDSFFKIENISEPVSRAPVTQKQERKEDLREIQEKTKSNVTPESPAKTVRERRREPYVLEIGDAIGPDSFGVFG